MTQRCGGPGRRPASARHGHWWSATGTVQATGIVEVAGPASVRRLGLRVLLLAVALGLVVMHHVVGAHPHGPPPGPAASGVAMPTAAAVIPAGAGHAAHPVTEAGGTAAQHGAPAPAAQVTDQPAGEHGGHGKYDGAGHPDGPDDDGLSALLHLCFAVLSAMAALAGLAALVALAWRGQGYGHGQPSGDVGAAPPARPPPVSLRLAQLQILRL